MKNETNLKIAGKYDSNCPKPKKLDQNYNDPNFKKVIFNKKKSDPKSFIRKILKSDLLYEFDKFYVFKVKQRVLTLQHINLVA